MKDIRATLPRRYQMALMTHLRSGTLAGLTAAHVLGNRAKAVGVSTLEIAKIHEQILITKVLPEVAARTRATLVRRAGIFFAATVVPATPTRRTARASAARLLAVIRMLSRRAVALASSNDALQLEITHRKVIEEALTASKHSHVRLLKQSDLMQGRLRDLSRQILSGQEGERRRISRELHDVIGRTLTGINFRLAALSQEAAVNKRSLNRNIARTQLLVGKSVEIVQRFARDLRPAVLDDLGLIPALHAYMKIVTVRTGLRIRLTACAAVEQLDMEMRTVFYRVTQEALTNVARHAKAGQVEVGIVQAEGWFHVTIKDDGRAFAVEKVHLARGRKRLGLLGMRERLEMVGGRFGVESTKGVGTTITASLPVDGTTNRRAGTPVKRPVKGRS